MSRIKKQEQLVDIFSFKPLEESDLDLLCVWLNKPHVNEWWHDELTTEDIKTKYRKRIGSPLVVPFIVYLNDTPIGFIQYWWPDEKEGVVGIDQFIGEEDYINRGYGTHLILGFVKKLFANPSIRTITTDPYLSNYRAIRCYEKVGFKFIEEIKTPDGVVYLMEIVR